uniref:Uncharacterized protein n=1 Tax=Anguilla anguilla TaxID=7936 RepID=A0A0E9URA8_ANGAN
MHRTSVKGQGNISIPKYLDNVTSQCSKRTETASYVEKACKH